jgi:hypothetical protein
MPIRVRSFFEKQKPPIIYARAMIARNESNDGNDTEIYDELGIAAFDLQPSLNYDNPFCVVALFHGVFKTDKVHQDVKYW